MSLATKCDVCGILIDTSNPHYKLEIETRPGFGKNQIFHFCQRSDCYNPIFGVLADMFLTGAPNPFMLAKEAEETV